MDSSVEFGSIVAIQVIIIVHLKLLVEWRSLNLFTFVSFSLSLLGFVVICIVLNSFIMRFPVTVVTEGQSYFWSIYQIFSYPTVWLCFFLSAAIAIIPDIFIKIIENTVIEFREAKKLKRMQNMDKANEDISKSFKERTRKRDCNIFYLLFIFDEFNLNFLTTIFLNL